MVLIYIAGRDADTDIADGARGGKGLSYLAGISMYLGTCPQSRGSLFVLPLTNIYAKTSLYKLEDRDRTTQYEYEWWSNERCSAPIDAILGLLHWW